MKIIFRSKTAIQTELAMQWLEIKFKNLEKWILISVFENYSAPKYKQSQQWQQISVMTMNISNATLWPNRQLITKITPKVTPRTAIYEARLRSKTSGIPNKLNLQCFVKLEIFPILKKEIQAAKKRLKIMEA